MKFLIIPNCLKEETAVFSVKLAEILHDRGQQVLMYREHAEHTGALCDSVTEKGRCPDADAAIILGGDGTVLATMHQHDLFDLPFFGINFGRVGYLTECEPADAEKYIDAILNRTCIIEKRIILEGTMECSGHPEQNFLGFNEAVIHRSCLSRALKFRVCINENCITDFSGDGILVSTPTGSTAYNISAGGPVLMPESDCFVITPICAQFQPSCPLVVSGSDRIDIYVLPVLRTGDNDEDQPRLDVDSYRRFTVYPGTVLHFYKSSRQARMIKIGRDSFYRALKKRISATN